MSTAITTYQPSLLGRSVLNGVFDNLFTDFPRHLRQTTQGYPVVDIYRDEAGNTMMEFALAGFAKEDLDVHIQPDKRSITVSANLNQEGGGTSNRRIARRNFEKTYVNYDNNLDLSQATADFENGLLTVKVPQRAEMQPVTVKIE
jgi:HSP20 family molecular chaperone IbpA